MMPVSLVSRWSCALVCAALSAACACSALAAPAKKAPSARSAAVTGPLYARRADVMAQADDIAQRRDLDPQWVRQVIGQARYLRVAARLITPPPRGVAKNWRAYRARFIEPERVQAGVRFWQTHTQTLRRAEAEFGVPADIIVGIIGVETLYGQQTGNFRVIDTLATLAFDFPASHPRATERSAFFKSELEQFLTLHRRAGSDPMAVLGSYAGAMGMAQFMPSSWVKYAVDFDGDGKIDLFHSPGDVIGSVANYFKSFGWKSGMPTHYAVTLDPTADMGALLAPDILPSFSVASFQAKGARLEGAALQHPGPLALVELQNGDPAENGNAPSYVAGTENFYAITRYNWSSYYAMAVIELGRAVAVARGASDCTACVTMP